MIRFPGCILVVLVVLVASAALAQTPSVPAAGARPAPTAPAGTPLPGMPPRSTATEAPLTGTATLRGRVVGLDTGMPLRRAQVSVTLSDGRQLRRATTTDGEGRYEFQELPAGRFSVSVTKAGYVSLQHGQRRPFEAGTPVTVADGQVVERIDVSLPRGSVIAVRVTDEFGEPIAGAMVQVQRYQYGPDGQRRLQSVPSGGGTPFAGTDDRGELRAFSLMPGEYVVQASTRSIGGLTRGSATDSSEGFSPTFYPGTISAAEAQPVTVGIGEEVAIQFSMVAARLARITGRVVDSEGQPAPGAMLSIVTVTGTGMSSYSAGQTSADGSFAISGIAPGEHTLRVTKNALGAGESGSVPITVGSSDLAGLTVTLGTGATITGTVVFEGTSPRTGGPPLRVMASQADPQRQFALLGSVDPLANGTVGDDGSFKLAGASGRAFIGVSPTPGWVVKSVMLDGEDISDTPIDLSARTTLSDVRIVLTDRQTTIAGQVADNSGRRVNDYVVVIQPAEQKEAILAARWIRLVRPDTSGRFETRGMRPGRYLATAVEALEQGQQFAPDVQARLRSSGRAFEIAEGGSATVSLELTSGF